MSKGCGCSTGPLSKFKPPFSSFFYAACCKHDDAYEVGLSRPEADNQFFKDMLYLISKADFPILKIFYLIFIVTIYYLSVRLVGWKYWRT